MSFTTAAKPSAPVSVAVIGDGTRTGLYMTNPSPSFVVNEHDGMLIGDVPVGVYVPIVDDLVNEGGGVRRPGKRPGIARLRRGRSPGRCGSG